MLAAKRSAPLRCLVCCAATLAICSATLVCGCTGDLRDRKSATLLTQADADHYLAQAAGDPSPDRRRIAIERLVGTSFAGEDRVTTVLAQMALQDPSDSCRVAAVRALGRRPSPTTAYTCLELLESAPQSPTAAGPPDLLRAVAMQVLADIAEAGAVPPECADRAVKAGVSALKNDSSRNVRMAAADLLGSFARPEAANSLVEALQQRDFGVCYAAERSLIRLTGHTFHHNPTAWRQFLASTEDPFADRGALDSTLEARPPNWWEKNWASMREAFAGSRPPRKSP